MSNWSKNLIIMSTLLLLKTTSNKLSLIALKRTIRASFNLIDPLTSDQMNMWGTWHKIPRASPLKSSSLLSHRVLPFWRKNNDTIWRRWPRLTNYFREESIREEGSIGGEDGTSSEKEDGTTEKNSSEEAGASDKCDIRRV
jgi:hypothetical protein